MQVAATASLQLPLGTATCPVCAGSTRQPAGRYRYCYGYDPETDTVACRNCGGDTMSLRALGYTRVDPASGLGCRHEYVGENVGRCLTLYRCARCGDAYSIDSSD